MTSQRSRRPVTRTSRAVHNVTPLEPRRLMSAIVSGQTITGQFTFPGQTASYTFTPPAGSAYLVAVGATTTSGIAVDLRVSTGSGGSSSGGSHLSHSEDGRSTGRTITATLTPHKDNRTGPYAIELITVPSPKAPSGSDQKAISSGQTVTANIDRPGDIDAYTFTAAGGSTFTFSAAAINGSRVEPNLLPFSPAGVKLQSKSSSKQAQSFTYRVPSNGGGQYTVVVQHNDEDEVGAYQVHLDGGTAAAAAATSTSGTNAGTTPGSASSSSASSSSSSGGWVAALLAELRRRRTA